MSLKQMAWESEPLVPSIPRLEGCGGTQAQAFLKMYKASEGPECGSACFGDARHPLDMDFRLTSPHMACNYGLRCS